MCNQLHSIGSNFRTQTAPWWYYVGIKTWRSKKWIGVNKYFVNLLVKYNRNSMNCTTCCVTITNINITKQVQWPQSALFRRKLLQFQKLTDYRETLWQLADSELLRCDTESLNVRFCQAVQVEFNLNMDVPRSFRTSATAHPVTQ